MKIEKSFFIFNFNIEMILKFQLAAPMNGIPLVSPQNQNLFFREFGIEIGRFERNAKVIGNSQNTEIIRNSQNTQIIGNPKNTEIIENPKNTEIIENPKNTEIIENPKRTEIIENPKKTEIIENPQKTENFSEIINISIPQNTAAGEDFSSDNLPNQDTTFVMFKSIKFRNIKNKLVKKETFSIKIVADEETILRFENIHIFEFVVLALGYSCSEENSTHRSEEKTNLKKQIKIMNADVLESKKIIGDLVDDKHLISSYGSVCVQTTLPGPNLAVANKTSALLELMLSKQILIDVFCEMKTSVNQFFNFLRASMFVDIKNPPNSLDRLILKALKKKEMNYASRINIFSQLSLKSPENSVKERKIINSEYNFTPIYDERTYECPIVNNNFEFTTEYSLICRPDIVIERDKPTISVDKKYFKKVLEMSRIVYRNQDLKNEAIAFENEVVKFINKMYGNDALVFFKRILPTFFIKK